MSTKETNWEVMWNFELILKMLIYYIIKESGGLRILRFSFVDGLLQHISFLSHLFLSFFPQKDVRTAAPQLQPRRIRVPSRTDTVRPQAATATVRPVRPAAGRISPVRAVRPATGIPSIRTVRRLPSATRLPCSRCSWCSWCWT